jgi:hypothetical protein
VNATLVQLENGLLVALVNGAARVQQRAVEVRDEQLVRQRQLAAFG